MGDTSGGPAGYATRRRRPRRYITLKYLKAINACGPAQDTFKEVFGKRALIADVVRALHKWRHYNWEGWLLACAGKDIAGVMLMDGADINVREGYALRWVIGDRNRQRAKFLLEHGARVPRKDLDGDRLRWIMKVRKTAGGLLRDPRD